MKKVIKTSLLVLGMSLAVAALVTRWPEIKPALLGANPTLLWAAAVGLLAYQITNAGVWSLVLSAMGQPTPFLKTSRIWLQSEALRWLPGGIWGYGSRVVNAAELGIGKVKASASLVVELSLTILAWSIAALALFATPLLGMALDAIGGFFGNKTLFPILAIGFSTIILVLGCAFALRKKIISKLKDFQDANPFQTLRPKEGLKALAAYSALCLANGVLFSLVANAVPGVELPIIAAIGIGGAAWLVGFFAIGVPGGIGVREAALAAMLAAYGSLDAGIAIAVIWRALQIAVELLSLFLASSTSFLERSPKKPHRVFRAFNLL
ncbi:MAG: lysylphosphatidylglycerol synthase domain-containing protein [Verrucomicrobiota bacterium]